MGEEKADKHAQHNTHHTQHILVTVTERERYSKKNICIHVVVFHFTMCNRMGDGYQKPQKKIVFVVVVVAALFGKIHANDIFVNNKSF